MARFELGPEDALYYSFRPPRATDGVSFVFFNALTGDTTSWEAQIAPALREAGHGTLAYNLRGQVDSPFSAGAILDAAGVVDDAVKLLKHVHPPRPVFVGLSIGGLFAAQAAGTLPRIRPAPGLALAVGGHDRRPAVSLVAVKYGALRITAITMFMGAVGLWVVVGIFWKIWVNPAALFDRPPEQVTALLTIALWNTTITQFLWIGGLAAVPDITRGSYLFFLKPVIAAVLAVVFLSQQLTAWQVVAILVICSSVAVEALWARLKSS